MKRRLPFISALGALLLLLMLAVQGREGAVDSAQEALPYAVGPQQWFQQGEGMLGSDAPYQSPMMACRKWQVAQESEQDWEPEGLSGAAFLALGSSARSPRTID